MGVARAGSRRELLGAAMVGGLLVASASQASAVEPQQLRRLANQVRALSRASAGVDYDDPAAEADHYQMADTIMEAVIVTPATSWFGLRVKAEALVWCHGGRFELGPNPSQADRLLASMIADLLGSATNENIGGTSA